MEESQVCPPQSSPVVFEFWLAAWPSEVVLGPSPTECSQALCVRHSRIALVLSKGHKWTQRCTARRR